MKTRLYVFSWLLVLTVLASMPAFAQTAGCCYVWAYGPNQPPDHVWAYDPNKPDELNSMLQFRAVFSPDCPSPMPVHGVRLVAYGTGNDATDIDFVRLSYDLDCDGVADAGGLIAQSPGGYPVDNGTLDIWGPNPISLAGCLLIEYAMNPNAPCGETYRFNLVAFLDANGQPINASPCPNSNIQLRSAEKKIRDCDDCCIRVTYGPNHPPNHTWQCDPTNPYNCNFMMQAKISNPCNTPIAIDGVKLKAWGTGNDLTGINNVYIFGHDAGGYQVDCDPMQYDPYTCEVVYNANLQGTYDADNGILEVCDSTIPLAVLNPGDSFCLHVFYKMDCNAPPGTYYFTLEEILSDCQPVCSEDLPLESAVKFIESDPPEPCCPEWVGFPIPDHIFECIPGAVNEPNHMMTGRIRNTCPEELCVTGMKLQAGGTGLDDVGIQQVIVEIDIDCNQTVDVVWTGSYSADNGLLTIYEPNNPVCLAPNQIACFKVYYNMSCPPAPPPGTYYFELTTLLVGPDGVECAEPLSPSHSAVKTVPDDCCLDIYVPSDGPKDHVWQCDPTTATQLNWMQKVKICNPCDTPQVIHGFKLKAYGTGNDFTGIKKVIVRRDSNCNGHNDAWAGLSGVYDADDGTVTLCSDIPIGWLKSGECLCFNFYYEMECGAPAGTYWFEIVEVLGPNCEPICVEPLPVRSVVKTVITEPCCLKLGYGPKHPSNHIWTPPPPLVKYPFNRMMQTRICNPCPNEAKLTSITLQAGGTGNDQTDILDVRVYVDLNCNGLISPGDPLFGTGTYPADNGTLTITTTGSFVINPNDCVCLLVVYRMRTNPPPPAGRTYYFTLTGAVLVDPATGAEVCVVGPPLNSAVKTIKKKWIGEIKTLPLGTPVKFGPVAVTACFPEQDRTLIYVQEHLGEEDVDEAGGTNSIGSKGTRSSGIVIRPVSVPELDKRPKGVLPSVGDLMEVEGVLMSDGAELFINGAVFKIVGSAFVPQTPDGYPPNPFHLTGRASGGGAFGNQPGVFDDFWAGKESSGLNTVGLLVTMTGRVSVDNPDFFYLDDGSGLCDGSVRPTGELNAGIKVRIPAGVSIINPDLLAVTGILRAEDYFGRGIRTLWPRTEDDIVPISTGP